MAATAPPVANAEIAAFCIAIATAGPDPPPVTLAGTGNEPLTIRLEHAIGAHLKTTPKGYPAPPGGY